MRVRKCGEYFTAFVPGPAHVVRASESMYFVYLDEFGHIGPYTSRKARKHNSSPVFGIAGIILPEDAVRPFATFFLKQKEANFGKEIQNSRKIAAKWEKKGASFIRPNPMKKYVEARRLLHRVIKKIDHFDGKIFYHGREKIRGRSDLNANGLYKTVFSQALRDLDKFFVNRQENFVVVVDQHSARKELLECAVKTMYGYKPCRALASPPFEVESHLNQNIQAADWVATLIGKMAAFDILPEEYPDYQYFHEIFGDRVSSAKVNSALLRRSHAGTKGTSIDPDNPFAALLRLKQA